MRRLRAGDGRVGRARRRGHAAGDISRADAEGGGGRGGRGVTSIDAPATYARGQAFDVTLTVTTGGCLRFTGFDAARGPDRLTLTAVGRDGSGPGVACPADIRAEPHTYRVPAPPGDSLVVDVSQPRDVYLGRVVRRR